MKRILQLTLLLFLIGGTTDAYSQGFLKKLKEKAEKVSGKVLGSQQQEEQSGQDLQQEQELPLQTQDQNLADYGETEDDGLELGSKDPNAPRILSFSIGKETGILNHEKGTIDITVDPAIDFNNIVPTFSVGTGVNASPASGVRLNPDKAAYFTLRDGAGRQRVYELNLHLRGLERKDLRAGVKCGTLRMHNAMQGYPGTYVTYYFDNYGQTLAMINDLRTGTIIDYTTGKVISLEAVSTIAKLKEITDDVANLRMPDIPAMPTMQDLENAQKNGLKDVEYVYTVYDIPGLAEKFPNPLLTDIEVLPAFFLTRMNARKLPPTTVAGKPCFTLEVSSPEGDMRMQSYSWKNINFGGGMKGAVWSAVANFTESVPTGIFLPPKGWRTRAEWQKEADAVAEAANKTFRKNLEPMAQEFEPIRQFLDEYSRELTGHGLEEEK